MTKDQAKETIDQLGGQSRLNAMIGTKNFCYGNDGVGFMFKGSKIANCCKININSMDLYDIKFLKMGKNLKKIKEIKDVYSNQLINIFQQETGLALHL